MKTYSAIMFCFMLAAFLSSAFCQETEIDPANKFYGSVTPSGGLMPEKISLKQLDFKAYKYTLPMALLSGAMDGTNQTLNFHYYKFKERFPGARDQFWLPAISWQNKYAITPDNQILTNYEAFPFSTTLLVWTTDGHHLTRAGDHLFMLGSVTFNINERKVWYQYPLDFVTHFIARSIGFNLVYYTVFK